MIRCIVLIPGRGNLYPTADALNDAISRAQQFAAAAPEVSLDPDLNPAKFREMLRRLQNPISRREAFADSGTRRAPKEIID